MARDSSTFPGADDALLRVAIASDIHAYVPREPPPKIMPTLKVGTEGDGATVNPVAGLARLIEEQGLRADVLLSPGDLGDQANPMAIDYTWQVLQRLAKSLGADRAVASSGNHDLDSRYIYQKFDPLETLKKLSPRYPLSEEIESFRYWSHHFGLIDEKKYRLVVLNSSAFHWVADERERGRVSVATLSWLEDELRRREKGPSVNILLCHHHPHPHPDLRISGSGFGVMEDGNLLINVLGTGNYGEWIIVHGHKHHPQISYAAGTGQSPVVLSAGSLSGPIYDELGSVARNQFYILEIPLDKLNHMGLVGSVRAWTWVHGKGWVDPSGSGDGLPLRSPFGCRENPVTLAGQIERQLATQAYLEWREVLHAIPALDHLLPADVERLKLALRERHSIEILSDDDGRPVQVGRLT